jgi:hypothetical protein
VAAMEEGDFTEAAVFTEVGFAAADLVFLGRMEYPFGYSGYYDDDYVSCYVVRQRIHTRYGWRIRRVQICD